MYAGLCNGFKAVIAQLAPVAGLNYCCDMHWFRAVKEVLLTDVFDDVALPVSAAEVAAHRASSSLAGT